MQPRRIWKKSPIHSFYYLCFKATLGRQICANIATQRTWILITDPDHEASKNSGNFTTQCFIALPWQLLGWQRGLLGDPRPEQALDRLTLSADLRKHRRPLRQLLFRGDPSELSQGRT